MRRFWYFDVSVWSGEQKLWYFGLCQNGVLAPYCKDWEPRYPPNTSKRLRIPWLPLRYPKTPPRHPKGTPQISPGNTTFQQTPTDTARHPKTLRGAVWVCLAVSIGVCCCLFACPVQWRCLGGVCGISGGCPGIFEWYSWKSEALGCVWGVSGLSVLAVWSQNTILAQPQNGTIFLTWLYWDIKIPKPPHISFPKMIGLVHFFNFLGSPEKNYLSQLLLITLYH